IAVRLRWTAWLVRRAWPCCRLSTVADRTNGPAHRSLVSGPMGSDAVSDSDRPCRTGRISACNDRLSHECRRCAEFLNALADCLPDQMMARERLIDIARSVYRSYGFAPIDTPALEYAEVLLGKGGEESDKQVFRFTDQGDRDVAMRFDLTVPLARFSAQYVQE